PTLSKPGKKVDASRYSGILEDDARHLAAFVERWRPRVATITHARHRTMLGVVLGESKEHQRLFEQAASGLEDVIGKRTAGAERVGAVLPTRWQEEDTGGHLSRQASGNDAGCSCRDCARRQPWRSRNLPARGARCVAPSRAIA